MDPYKTLGVANKASEAEIKTAFRNLAKRFHPDLNPGNKAAEQRFKDINRAYEMIGSPDARAKYDRGETDEQMQQRWEQQQSRREGGANPFYYYETQQPSGRYSMGGEGFDPSIFENLFGGFGRARQAHPQDEHYRMPVDFITSILGGEREITLPSGKRLAVKIPAGVKSGAKLRLAKGAAEGGGGAGGDAYLEIDVQPSSIFRRIDNDLELDLPVSLPEAILGAEVRVATVDGPVLLVVPAGVSTGARLRIKGKGVPVAGGRGDQFAVVRIVLPKTIDPELAQFVKQWSERHAYNPRVE